MQLEQCSFWEPHVQHFCSTPCMNYQRFQCSYELVSGFFFYNILTAAGNFFKQKPLKEKCFVAILYLQLLNYPLIQKCFH